MKKQDVLKNMVNMSNYFDDNNMIKEADIIDGLMKKVADDEGDWVNGTDTYSQADDLKKELQDFYYGLMKTHQQVGGQYLEELNKIKKPYRSELGDSVDRIDGEVMEESGYSNYFENSAWNRPESDNFVQCMHCKESWDNKTPGYGDAKQMLEDYDYQMCPSCEQQEENIDPESTESFLRDIGEDDMADTYGTDEYHEAYSEKGDPDFNKWNHERR